MRGYHVCLCRLLWLTWLLALSLPAAAWVEVTAPSHALGQQMTLLRTPTAISLEDAIRAQRAGTFQPSRHAIPRLGIGAAPHWLHVPLYNPSVKPMQRTLQLGMAWLDRLDIYLLHEGRVIDRQQAGDGQSLRLQASPGLGYLAPLTLPPGRTELYVQVTSADPMILPAHLLDDRALAGLYTSTHYSYGAMYGFLLALMAYNLMLYAGLRERNNLNYSIYLGAFILLSLSYTGHAGAWLWPDSLFLKRAANPVLMVLVAWLGLHFARHFLKLDSHAPRLASGINTAASLCLLTVVLLVTGDWHVQALWLAFACVFLYTLLMVLLGLISLRHGRVAARYFLTATLCGMFGTAITDLAVWGVIPFSDLTYRAVDIGILLEATLLALALAYQMRRHQQARLKAETLARIDPLTGLLNRRAFLEQGSALWSTALRHGQPLALIMLDLDHFKSINDQHGHDVGDNCLIATARLLSQQCRTGDILARWGGEEFLLLLPATRLQEALQLAERLRQALAGLSLEHTRASLTLSASFGVIAREQQEQLEQLINAADERLYQAKQSGRNRVCGPQANVG